MLVVALGGFIDAGHTQRLMADHILETHEARVIASFDVDQLLDYRGRRPVMVFDRDHWSSYDDPSLLLHRVVDKEGVPFLLLVGPEPDYQWNRMVEATGAHQDVRGRPHGQRPRHPHGRAPHPSPRASPPTAPTRGSSPATTRRSARPGAGELVVPARVPAR